ncbi:hypothetical protein HID58_014509 [Brassica napus]|uniref:Uncharacterized protein n=1 Tax=Brassica napus TaxID=3708 RepID=A0ABQ8DHC1_BRANA|nr:hypothetical protein HID58_014509 [Brassica napus]
MPDTCKDQHRQNDTRLFCLNLTITASSRRPELHHRKPRAQNTGEPPSAPTLLFHTLSSLRRASSIQSRSHSTEQSREPLETTKREPHPIHKRDPQPIHRN